LAPIIPRRSYRSVGDITDEGSLAKACEYNQSVEAAD
jgi:hypothetical protein